MKRNEKHPRIYILSPATFYEIAFISRNMWSTGNYSSSLYVRDAVYEKFILYSVLLKAFHVSAFSFLENNN